MRWVVPLVFVVLAACERVVVIEVSGPTTANLTADTATGSVHGPVPLPWATTIRAQPGRSISMVASQGYGETGELVCRITVDGVLWRESKASGPGARVSCFGAVGSQ